MHVLLHQIYPLLVASVVAFGITPLALPFSLENDSDNIKGSDNIPESLRKTLKFNLFIRRSAPFLLMIALIFAFVYVYPEISDEIQITWSFNIIVTSYILIILGFIVPAIESTRVYLVDVIDKRRERHELEESRKNLERSDNDNSKVAG